MLSQALLIIGIIRYLIMRITKKDSFVYDIFGSTVKAIIFVILFHGIVLFIYFKSQCKPIGIEFPIITISSIATGLIVTREISHSLIHVFLLTPVLNQNDPTDYEDLDKLVVIGEPFRSDLFFPL